MLADDWVERLEAGALRHSARDRAALLERLIVAHERYDEIAAAWAAETRRRIKEVRAGRAELIPFEVVMAELEQEFADAPDTPEPPIPELIDEIEDQALYLPHDEFYLLLTKLEAGLPVEIDPVWRAEIQRRIAAVPAEVERRYRECNGGWEDDDDLPGS